MVVMVALEEEVKLEVGVMMRKMEEVKKVVVVVELRD